MIVLVVPTISVLVVEVSESRGSTDVLLEAAVVPLVVLVGLGDAGLTVKILSVCIFGKYAAVISSSNNSPISSIIN